jgi:hypothetical protein
MQRLKCDWCQKKNKRHDRIERSTSTMVSYSIVANDPPTFTFISILPLYNRLQPEQRFSETKTHVAGFYLGEELYQAVLAQVKENL